MNTQPSNEVQPPKRSRKKTILMVAFLLVAIIAGVLWLTWPREPSYNGKPLSYWLTAYMKAGATTSDPKAIECRDAIRHMGTNALPALLRMLRARDSALETKLVELLGTRRVARFRFPSAYEQNSKAAYGFWALGELATSSIPALIEIYTNPPSDNSTYCADSALKALYPASSITVPIFIPLQDRAEWYSEAAAIQMQLGSLSNAVLAFSDAIKLDPTNDTIYLNRASAKIQLQDFAGALPDLAKTISLDSSNQSAFTLSGFCKIGLKDFQGAETDFTAAINLHTNDSSAYNYRGLARANLRRFDDAVADFNAAIELDDSEAAAYRNRAHVEGMQKEFELALQDIAKAMELEDKDAYTWQVRGFLNNSLRDYKAAYQDFDRAVHLNPKDPVGYAGRGSASMCLDDFPSASADLEKALQLDPKNAAAHIVRGYLKAKRGGADGEALVDFQHAVELNPQVPDTHAILGLFQYRCNQREPALKNCRKALEMGAINGRSDLQACIWLIRAQTGEETEASRELETFLKSLPGSKTNDWEISVVRYFSGSLTESNFLSQATTTAPHPSAVKGQVCESLYYVGMKHKLAGDKQGALKLFQKCVDTKDNNNLALWNAATEMRALTNK